MLIAFNSTSADEYQVLCRVDGVTLEQQESALKLLAITFDVNAACPDGDRVLRLLGLLRCDYGPAYPATVECPSDSTWNLDDFRLDIGAATAILCPLQFHRESMLESTPIPTTIGMWLEHELDYGKDAKNFAANAGLKRRVSQSSSMLRTRSAKPAHREYPDGTTVSRCFKFGVASRLPLHFALPVCARLRSLAEGNCLEKGSDFTLDI
jgi:hypothetical protein